jgi:hypothetical protein
MKDASLDRKEMLIGRFTAKCIDYVKRMKNKNEADEKRMQCDESEKEGNDPFLRSKRF